jgi:hypothetical protein
MTLPSDLERLGDTLEVAALRAVRRRARRQAILNALCALAVTLPVTFAISTADGGAPEPRMPSAAPELATFSVWAPARAADIALHRLPDQWLPPVPVPACLDGNDCRRPVPPTRLVYYPDPARRA